MADLLDEAVAVVRRLSLPEQNEIAAIILGLAANPEPEPIDPAHLPAVLEGLSQARRREFASEDEVKAALASFDP